MFFEAASLPLGDAARETLAHLLRQAAAGEALTLPASAGEVREAIRRQLSRELADGPPERLALPEPELVEEPEAVEEEAEVPEPDEAEPQADDAADEAERESGKERGEAGGKRLVYRAGPGIFVSPW